MAPETAVQVIDLDAVETKVLVRVRIGSDEYAVRSHLDIPLEEVEEILALYQQMMGKPWHEQLRIGRRLVRILCPAVPEEKLLRWTGRQITSFVVQVIGAGAMVPEAPPEKE